MSTKNTNPKKETKIEFSKDVLDSLNALSISENVKANRKSIFKDAYNDKALRTKYRNALMKVSKQEIENGKTIDVQKGLIPQLLLEIKSGKLEKAKETFSEISEICKKVYIAEDSFKNAEDYFSSNRNAETQNILKAFIKVAQTLQNA